MSRTGHFQMSGVICTHNAGRPQMALGSLAVANGRGVGYWDDTIRL